MVGGGPIGALAVAGCRLELPDLLVGSIQRIGERLVEVHQERAFTHVRRGLSADEEIDSEKIAEVVTVVVGQLQAARELGAADVRGVATAAVRRAANREALLSALPRADERRRSTRPSMKRWRRTVGRRGRRSRWC